MLAKLMAAAWSRVTRTLPKEADRLWRMI